jgi:hypothetical protein
MIAVELVCRVTPSKLTWQLLTPTLEAALSISFKEKMKDIDWERGGLRTFVIWNYVVLLI